MPKPYRAGLLALVMFVACQSEDTTISARVKERFEGGRTPTAQVAISTTDRIVRLEGVVVTSGERDRLERVARETPGVIAVDNRLVVQPPVTVTGTGDGERQEP